MNWEEHYDVLEAAYRLGGDVAMEQVALTIGYPHYAALDRMMWRVRMAARDLPGEIERSMRSYFHQFMGMQLPRTNTQRESLCGIMKDAATRVLKSFEGEGVIAIRRVEAADDWIGHAITIRATFNLTYAADPEAIYAIQLSVSI